MSDSGENRAKVRILVLDEQPLLRFGVSAYLNSQPDMIVCGEADSISAAQKKIAECSPQLLLTSLQLGAGDSLRFVKTLKTEQPGLLILVYSAFEETIFAERTARVGAAGYVMKSAPMDELVAAIRHVLKGGIYISRELALSAFKKSLQRRRKNNQAPRSANSVENLSDREMHIFQLLGSGLGTKQIADSLALSVKTVESHRGNIKLKLRLRSSAELRQHAARWVEKTFQGRKNTVTPVV
jgi:DNA-binding NarL/FixJ family response regulator